ncbi:hypothetical protein NDU88_000815 [Pleurodeles waltl]|uniref:Uncharacterized protein n=1 Tax=Pleurodeles waltl TaxID=8319 RepID=A0AAV7WKD9_PLEWA|nr:hypothetical protein NDU88_000815 [Pleurodeles waltl]
MHKRRALRRHSNVPRLQSGYKGGPIGHCLTEWDLDRSGVVRGTHIAVAAIPNDTTATELTALDEWAETQQGVLDTPIETTEVQLALQQLAGGKAPGSDGLPAEYYRACSGQLIQPYVEMVHEVLERETGYQSRSEKR